MTTKREQLRWTEFRQVDLERGEERTIRLGGGDMTWGTIADSFLEFLLSCGFQLDRQDLADHFDQSCFLPASTSSEAEDRDPHSYGLVHMDNGEPSKESTDVTESSSGDGDAD